MPDHRRTFEVSIVGGIRAPFRIIGGQLEMCAQLRFEVVVTPGVAEQIPDADDALA